MNFKKNDTFYLNLKKKNEIEIEREKIKKYEEGK